ncbi:MAG: hypothetical protein ABI616_02450 [Pseudomonadota bacterium]
MLIRFATLVQNLLRSRVVLASPEAPEDTRVLRLFRNRAELKKAFGDAQDEIHRLKDRVKLQEAATSRVQEQLAGLETRLATPAPGVQALIHYQLRDLWATGHALIGSTVREMAQQREDRERRQFTADLNRQVFERQQAARRAVAAAEHSSADVRAKLASVQASLVKASSWWQYFRRKDLLRRKHAMQAEARSADATLEQARLELQQIEDESGAKFPGLSLESRRALNLTAIAFAQVLALKLAPTSLLARAADAMSRSEPNADTVAEVPAGVASMLEIARAKVAIRSGSNLGVEARRLAEHVRESMRYYTHVDTTPSEDSVQAAMLMALSKPQAASWDVLRQDLWSVSDLLYS